MYWLIWWLLLILVGLIGYFIIVRPLLRSVPGRRPTTPRRKYATVTHYHYGDDLRWRWHCAEDNAGEEDFIAEQDAAAAAREQGYDTRFFNPEGQ